MSDSEQNQQLRSESRTKLHPVLKPISGWGTISTLKSLLAVSITIEMNRSVNSGGTELEGTKPLHNLPKIVTGGYILKTLSTCYLSPIKT